MAIISSHILNTMDGTHANGIKASFFKLISPSKKELVFDTYTDEGGRMLKEISLTEEDCEFKFELVFNTEEYFANQNPSKWKKRTVSEVVIRISLDDPQKKYHIPIMLSPNNYSIWWSE
tara:strand:+ start:219 stop:575 length:357 start_codon:yes stop_codon:yes gene_type:complete